MKYFFLALLLTACAAPTPTATPAAPTATVPPASPTPGTASAQPTPAAPLSTPTNAGDRADGAELLYTPPSPASAQNAQFSPGGETLLFTLFHNGYNLGPAGLYLLRLTEGAAAPLLDEPGQDSVNLPGAGWRAATGRIVFASDRQDADEIWTIAADGTGLSRVTEHASPPFFIEPSFSPDGGWIVFEAAPDTPDDQRRGSLWKVRADGTELTQLTGDGADDRQPNWSPTGDRIVFQRRVPGSGDWNLFTLAPDGSSLRQVTTALSSDTDASWSPDGRWIVYSSDHGGLPAPAIFIIPAEGGTPTRVTGAEAYNDYAPSWSPDGKWIAFESRAGDDEQTPTALWRIPAPSQFAIANPQSPPAGDWWRPALVTSWQWQLGDLPVDTSFDAAMYDIDLFDNDASVVATLHAQGRKVICYISVGSWEDWRPDKDQFPTEVIGKDYKGWPGEKWLDIRQIDRLAPIMRARFDLCQERGFDGIEPDNIDAYGADTGFPLTAEDQLKYNMWLADEAHKRGLSIGLKNDGDQAAHLAPYFDWALTEDCFAQDWCEQMRVFIQAGKPVFAIEYTDTGIALDQFCPQAKAMKISAILKNRNLDAYREVCR